MTEFIARLNNVQPSEGRQDSICARSLVE
jgi:hypothetical protein